MDVTVRQLAEWVRGEVLGDPDLVISNARTLADAGPGDVTFVESDRNLHAWHDSKASAAVVGRSVPLNGRPIIRVADPLLAFADIVRHLRPRPEEPRGLIDPTACVHPTARLAPGVSVGPLAVVGEGTTVGADTTVHAGAIVGKFCAIGCGTTLYPRAVLYDGCVLGDRVIVHSGAVLGADGFGFRTHNGRHIKVPQQGWVEVGDDVEIGACSTVDRGTFGPTRIGTGTKIDNLVMIGHNCQIGRHNILCGQVGIAGSCVTGDYVVMAGQVGVADHVTVGSMVVIGAQAGVSHDLPGDQTYLGNPVVPARSTSGRLVTLRRVPEMREDIRQIKKHLGLKGNG